MSSQTERNYKYLRDHRGQIFRAGSQFGESLTAQPGMWSCNGCDGNYMRVVWVEPMGVLCFGCLYLMSKSALQGGNKEEIKEFLRKYYGQVYREGERFGPVPRVKSLVSRMLQPSLTECIGCGGTYAEGVPAIDGVGPVCLNCMYLMAQLALMEPIHQGFVCPFGRYSWIPPDGVSLEEWYAMQRKIPVGMGLNEWLDQFPHIRKLVAQSHK